MGCELLKIVGKIEVLFGIVLIIMAFFCFLNFVLLKIMLTSGNY